MGSAHGRMNYVLLRVTKFLARRRFPGDRAGEQRLAVSGFIFHGRSGNMRMASGWISLLLYLLSFGLLT